VRRVPLRHSAAPRAPSKQPSICSTCSIHKMVLEKYWFLASVTSNGGVRLDRGPQSKSPATQLIMYICGCYGVWRCLIQFLSSHPPTLPPRTLRGLLPRCLDTSTASQLLDNCQTGKMRLNVARVDFCSLGPKGCATAVHLECAIGRSRLRSMQPSTMSVLSIYYPHCPA
jgi:hypothetical protein